jgi:RNA-directed DNA polymerase
MRHPWSSQKFTEGARAAGRNTQVIAAAQSAAEAIKQAHADLPVVLTLSHLAHMADVSPRELGHIIDRQIDPYRIFRVKKRATPGRGAAAPRRYRTICVPNPELMRLQRWITQHILNAIAPHPCSFAFAPKKDLVGAAERHANCRWLVKMDVRHFFESINEAQAYGVFQRLGYGALIAFEMARLCTRADEKVARRQRFRSDVSVPDLPYRVAPMGHLPQGAPTSPMLANLAVLELDRALDSLAHDRGWTYTRYADDLAFSTRQLSTRGRAIELVKLAEQELVRFGLIAHRQKTSITPPGARKILLGVLVDRDRPHLTQEFRNNVETHLYALTSPKIGAAVHCKRRGFASVIGMRRHVTGLIAFAHQVDEGYAHGLYAAFNTIDWSR